MGNTQGIKITKAILEQCGFQKKVATKTIDGNLILSPIKIREGWEESFQEMAVNGDDKLVIDDLIPTTYDEEWEWEW